MICHHAHLNDLRPREEIQRAHDMLLAVILGEVELPTADKAVLARINAQCDVLCWVLKHDHNFAFRENLKALQAEFDSLGIVETRGKALVL